MAKGEDGSLILFDLAGSDRLDDDALLLGKPDYSLSTNDDLPPQIISPPYPALRLSFRFFQMAVVLAMRAVFEPHLALPAH